MQVIYDNWEYVLDLVKLFMDFQLEVVMVSFYDVPKFFMLIMIDQII